MTYGGLHPVIVILMIRPSHLIPHTIYRNKTHHTVILSRQLVFRAIETQDGQHQSSPHPSPLCQSPRVSPGSTSPVTSTIWLTLGLPIGMR